MRDPAKVREAVLNGLLVSSSRQLEESTKDIEDIKSILPLAKNPRERTTINIILDDQKKVVKSLERLIADLAESI